MFEYFIGLSLPSAPVQYYPGVKPVNLLICHFLKVPPPSPERHHAKSLTLQQAHEEAGKGH